MTKGKRRKRNGRHTKATYQPPASMPYSMDYRTRHASPLAKALADIDANRQAAIVEAIEFLLIRLADILTHRGADEAETLAALWEEHQGHARINTQAPPVQKALPPDILDKLTTTS